MGRLVINGDEVYELDEECLREKYYKEKKKEIQPLKKETEKHKNWEHKSVKY